MELLLFLCPSFVGLSLYKHLVKENNLSDLVIKYGVITCLTNIITLSYFYITMSNFSFSTMIDNVSFELKYMLINGLSSIVVGFMLYVIKRSVVVDVKVEKEKNTKKTSK